MTYKRPVIRKVTGNIIRYLYCPECGYRDKIVQNASRAWRGADCPKCHHSLKTHGVKHAP